MSQVSILFQGLVSVAVVSMIVLGVGAIITRQLRQPIERVRCIQWTLAALVVAVFVRQAAILPSLSLQVLPAESASVSATAPRSVSQHSTGDVIPFDTARMETPFINSAETADLAAEELPASPPVKEAMPPLSWSAAWFAFQLTCLCVAAAGALFSFAQWLIGHWQLRQLVADSVPANELLSSVKESTNHAIPENVRVLVSRKAMVPMTFGLVRPVIILPSTVAESTNRRAIAYCLAHEYAHIKSGDIRTWCAVQWLQPLLWFQPAFWFLRRELRTAQDQLADDFAAGRDLDRTEYAKLLLEMARARTRWSGGVALTMVADRRSSLYRRIELLLSEQFRLAHVARRRILWSTAACFALVAIVLGTLRLDRAAASPVDEAPTPTQEASTDGKEQEDAANQPAKQNEDAVELAYSGVVLDKETKQPIAGATVVVRRSVELSYERRIMEESQHTTDENGIYKFTIPPEQTAERGLYIELDVEHSDYAWKKGFGYALGMIRKNERLGEKPFFSKIELNPAEPLTGRIVNPEGKPLAGVTIQAYSKTSADDWQDYGSFFQTTSDQDGRFRLQLVKGGPSVFWVVPREYCPIQIVSGTKRGDWGDIVVKPGIEIEGKVVSATGEPVADVWVNLEDQQVRQEIRLPVATYVNRSAKTDADGTFKLRPMQAGKYRINVENHGSELTGEKQSWQMPQPLDDVFVAKQIEIGPQDEGRPLTVQATPHVEFHAQYVDSQGEPTSGHDVMIFGQFDGQWFHASLDPDKHGKIVGKLPHGLTKVQMDAITNEHGAIQVRLEKDGPLRSGRRLELGTIEDDITGVEFIRYKAPIVQLKPVDEEGKIIKDVKVSGIYEDGRDETMQPVGGLATNIFFEHQDDGRHRTSQMIPNRKVKFTASAEGYEDASAIIELPEGEEQELVLVLKKVAPGGENNAENAEKAAATSGDSLFKYSP